MLFLDTGDHPCTVNKDRHVSVRGMREVAYRTRAPFYVNDFADSRWGEHMPRGHLPMDNVLFAPLMKGGKPVGLLGLANKKGGFTDADAGLAGAFAEIAAVALMKVRTVELLESSNRLNETLLSAIPFAIDIVDEDGNVLYVDKKLEALFGKSVKEKKCFELYKDDGKRCAECPLTVGMDEGATRCIEVEGVMSGRTVEIWHTGMVFQGKNAILEVMVDVTERKKVEDDLKRSEERHALAQRAANIGSWDWNIRTREFVCSEEMEPMFGFRPGEFGGTYEEVVARIHEEDQPLVASSVEACVKGGESYAVDHRVVWPDGSIHWIAVMGDILLDEAGKPARILGVVQDITDRKRAEEEIRSLARFPSENTNPVLRLDEGGAILYANDASRKLLEDRHHTDEERAPDSWRKMVESAFRSGQQQVVEEESFGRVYSFTVVPVLEAGYANVYVADITERKRAEAELRQRTHDLGERVKELGCLYGLSKLEQDPDATLETVFSGLVNIIPPSLQYPEITCAAIVFEGCEFKTSGFRRTQWAQTAPIKIHGRGVGEICVCYLEEKPEIYRGPFLREEEDLIGALAERLGRFVERTRVEDELREAHDQLERRVQERTFELLDANDLLKKEIAERSRTQESLSQAREDYRTLVDTIDGIVWEADACTFEFGFVSKRAERLLGYPISRWLDEATFWSDHIHPDDRQWTVNYCVDATKRMEDHEFEYRMTAADGRTVWLRDIVTVIVEDGKPVMLRGIMVDITDMKKQAAALAEARRDATVGRMAAAVAHEVNNPLAAMKMQLTLLGLDLADMDPRLTKSIDTDSRMRVRQLQEKPHDSRCGHRRLGGRAQARHADARI